MSVGIDLLIALILWTVERYGATQPGGSTSWGWPFAGFLFMLYVQLYALKRFALGFLRGDVRPILGPFAATHLLALAGLILASALMVRGLAHGTTRRKDPAAGR
jgi:prolipoprotein diacylglyceryltransferase